MYTESTFPTLLLRNLPALNGSDLIKCYDSSTENLLEVVRGFLPAEKRFPRTLVQVAKLELPPWWNEVCSEAVRCRKEAIRKFLSAPSDSTYLEFRKARVDCSKKLSEQKRIGWRNFVGGFDSKTPTNRIWALIKSFKRKSSQLDFSLQDFIQVSMEAISKLCPSLSFFDRSETLASMKAEDDQNPNICAWLDDPLTLKKFRIALESLRRNSAPGLDQICYKMMNQLPEEYETCLLAIFNEILSEGTFPDSWKTSLIIFISKPGNRAVRPISLMSCVNSWSEFSTEGWFVESNPILPQAQAGFRPFRGCDDNLAVLISDIRTGFLERSVTVEAFLDIVEAFDNVDPFILSEDLNGSSGSLQVIRDGVVGATVFSPGMDGVIKHRLPSETSVFFAELWAILQAIQFIGDLNIKKSVIF
ncbi:PREDICTED: RNA-directed DNA polymerase from mobile element jockey-like [Cyphomyrmex costatus]|uniref:RNA-directed DNA polymerase from mobile element jockey-like n=1 Tax=Cyphomyrmex costatus TaxID=456900 RepID=UPI0008523E6D|nr:PREDICTED: RNA-directed DNA polymerase from mobile element jockey-like [Cyphomyrmex costatus]